MCEEKRCKGGNLIVDPMKYNTREAREGCLERLDSESAHNVE